jgi:hypothetical protein
MKNKKFKTFIREDQFEEMELPPGGTLHRADGQQIQPAEISFYMDRGEEIEMHQGGKRIGRIRLPNDSDEFSQNALMAMDYAMENAAAEKFVNAINWLDQAKERFWCAICAKNQSHPKCFSAWIGPEPECRCICYYAICKRCGNNGLALQVRNDREALTRIANLSEQRLLTRYPHIASNLPPGYL